MSYQKNKALFVNIVENELHIVRLQASNKICFRYNHMWCKMT